MFFSLEVADLLANVDSSVVVVAGSSLFVCDWHLCVREEMSEIWLSPVGEEEEDPGRLAVITPTSPGNSTHSGDVCCASVGLVPMGSGVNDGEAMG